MSDFSELEDELKKLRPARPSTGLFRNIEQVMAEPREIEEKIVKPNRFQLNWTVIGFSLAAAAVLLLVARINLDRRQISSESVAQSSPAPTGQMAPAPANQLIPADLTQVVYNRRNEGLEFARGYEQPLRRLRYQTRQTMQWRNPATGESLRVSYPSEEIVLVPISGQ